MKKTSYDVREREFGTTDPQCKPGSYSKNSVRRRRRTLTKIKREKSVDLCVTHVMATLNPWSTQHWQTPRLQVVPASTQSLMLLQNSPLFAPTKQRKRHYPSTATDNWSAVKKKRRITHDQAHGAQEEKDGNPLAAHDGKWPLEGRRKSWTQAVSAEIRKSTRGTRSSGSEWFINVP